MAGLRLHSPMLHPEHYCSQRRVRGQSDWLGFLCKTLSFSISSRFIPALSLTPSTVNEILGFPDDLKFRSSITLFASVTPEIPVFNSLIAKYFNGLSDHRTLEIIRVIS
jgi:hypothetical protein